MGAPDAGGWMREYFRHARAVDRAALRALEAAEGQHSGAAFRRSATGARASPTPSSASRATASTSARRSGWRPIRTWCCALSSSWRGTACGFRRGRAAHRGHACRAWPNVPRVAPACGRRCGASSRCPRCRRRCSAMHETGALGAMFPGVRRDRLPGDPRLLPSLHGGRAHAGRRAESGGAARDGAFAEILSDWRTSRPLVFALLFHDVGKGSRTGRTWRVRSRRPRRPWRASRCRSATARPCGS